MLIDKNFWETSHDTMSREMSKTFYYTYETRVLKSTFVQRRLVYCMAEARSVWQRLVNAKRRLGLPSKSGRLLSVCRVGGSWRPPLPPCILESQLFNLLANITFFKDIFSTINTFYPATSCKRYIYLNFNFK